jgi:hypothetical protein
MRMMSFMRMRNVRYDFRSGIRLLLTAGGIVFSKVMFDQQLANDPETAQHYQEQRKFLIDVDRRRDRPMSSKTRQKLEKRQQEGKSSSLHITRILLI